MLDERCFFDKNQVGPEQTPQLNIPAISFAMRKLLTLLAAGGLLTAAAANAQLVDRYDFSDADQGNDTVGGANGALLGNANITGGALVTTGSSGGYLQLPSSVGMGITGDFSIEDWVTRNETGSNYSSFFSFSSSATTGPGTPGNFLLLNPDRTGGLGTNAAFDQTGVNGSMEYDVRSATPTAFVQGVEQQVVLTYSASTGAINIYNSGNLIASGTLPGFSFATSVAGGYDGIGGGSPFGDPSFNGDTDDFRIYSDALTANQVAQLDADGPDATNAAINGIAAVPEPSAWTAAAIGFAALLGSQRLRRRQA